MRLSTVFISSAFILAGVSTALPLAKEDVLEARFADSDFLSEVDARAFDDEHKFYARGHDRPRSSPTHSHKLPSQEKDLDRRSYYVLYDDELVARAAPTHTQTATPTGTPITKTNPPNPQPERHVTWAPGTKGPPERHITWAPGTKGPPSN